MAPLNPRLAAGAGVLAALLVLGGPGAAVAVGHPADRGDSRGDRGSSSDRGGWGRGGSDRDDRGSGNGNRRGDGDHPGYGNGNKPGYGNGSRPGNGDGGSRIDDDSAQQDAEDLAPLEPGTARVGAQRLAPSDDSNQRAGSDDEDQGADSGSDSAGSPGSSGGSDRSSGPPAGFTPPRVTVGNGRSPVVQRRESKSSGGFSANDPAPAPAPAQAPPPSPPPSDPVQAWTDLIRTPPVVSQQLIVAPAVKTADPLWGIAGLLLIPAAGAALGYRQARAAQAAERRNRT
ncbi:hypothetical protein [Mycobacterium deserti]|uniref:Uncharacterized protein n=1 Tax=Mycobacterium deserti TaxID=2978347 RepID=A0ABT2MA79_9MYCO|nr:hypothetical protein [Mycobacterium deserti]MCT7659179.1 hypothetical protein [Mycobacterium deserti]